MQITPLQRNVGLWCYKAIRGRIEIGWLVGQVASAYFLEAMLVYVQPDQRLGTYLWSRVQISHLQGGHQSLDCLRRHVCLHRLDSRVQRVRQDQKHRHPGKIEIEKCLERIYSPSGFEGKLTNAGLKGGRIAKWDH